MKYLKLKCKECGTIFVADDTRHHINYCPKCNKSWVDMETHYMRHNGKTDVVEEFNPPYFKDEDDYHSALLGWLNDSDEEYELEKDYDNMILYVLKV